MWARIKMDRVCRWGKKSERKRPLGNLRVGGMIIFKGILRNKMEGCGIEL